ncbi:MAG: hypothetical protein RQ761_06960 [Bacteroidales bacterium]|nr:hypothetical protein [Bacteroidales bacterium]
MKAIFSPYLSRARSLRILMLSGIIVLMSTLSCTSQKGQKGKNDQAEKIVMHSGDGPVFEISFRKGPGHNHPLMAVWLEDTTGTYLQTLYVAESIGTGIFGHGRITAGHWEPGPLSRPAALPYWWHKYGFLPTPEQPVPDAISGPTPQGDFIMETDVPAGLPEKFAVQMEINQSWDWNEYWTNDKYPDNAAYMTSSQPAVVYKTVVDKRMTDKKYRLKIIGHSHYAGENGNLYQDITTLTSARQIAGEISVSIINRDK